MSNFYNFITRPFEADLWLFMTFFACSSIGICGYQTSARMTIYYAALAAIISYLAVLLRGLLGHKSGSVYAAFLLLFGFVNLITDIVVMETTGAHFSVEHVALMCGTNLSEGEEFFRSYITKPVMARIIVGLILCLAIMIISRKLPDTRCRSSLSVVFLALLCFLILFTNVLKSRNWGQISLAKVLTFATFERAPDLEKYRHDPVIEKAQGEDLTPDNVVLIIGESFSRSHSSLYGYDHQTNPRLSSMPNSYCFSEVYTTSTGTYGAFERMMTSAGENVDIDGKEWYECLKMFDITAAAGYYTEWISNQSRVGVYDNVVTSLAELTDSQCWVGEVARGLWKKDFDEILFPIVDSLVHVENHSKKMTIVHLMGSHPKYSSRYPEEFMVFTPDDYLDRPDNQRQVLSEYDNSILYNDYVVSSLIEKCFDLDALIIFLPDHGQDVFVSDSDFAGHAKLNDPISVKAAAEIPFVVTVTPQYLERNPVIVDRIVTNQQRRYSTANLLYTIADIMGVKMIDNNLVGDKSILFVNEE